MASLKKLVEIYDEQIKEADEKGYADLFKLSTYTCMKWITDAGFTVTDVKYLDGYFIFGTGTNSVIHYTIKECPNWTFAIWWSAKDDRITGEFFCEYDQLIDKFKPTRCEYSYTIEFNKNDLDDKEPIWLFKDVHLNTIKFISKHPLRAFYKSYCGADYNREYIPVRNIIFEFIGFKLNKFIEAFLNKQFEKSEVTFIKKYILPLCDYDDEHSAELVCMGENWSPKYDIQCKIPDDADEDETGCFSVFEDEPDSKQLKIKNKWEKLNKRHTKIASIFNIWADCICDDFVNYYREKDFEEE